MNKQPANVNQRSISEDDSQYNPWIKAIRCALSGGSIVVGQDFLTFDDGDGQHSRLPHLTKEVLSCLPSSTVYHLASLACERDQPRLLECCIDALQDYTTQEFYALNPMTLNAIARLACKGYPRTLNSITKHLVDVPFEVCHSATLATIARASLEGHSIVLPMLTNAVNKMSLDTFLCLDPATVYHLAWAALVGFPDVLEALSPLLARLTPVQKALLHEGTGQKLQAVADGGHQQAYQAFFAKADTNKDLPSSSVSYPLAQQLKEALAAADKKNFAPLEACVPCLERLSVLELRQCPVTLVSSLASFSYYSKIHVPLNALARVCGLMPVDVLLDLHAHTFFNVIACAEQGQTWVFDAMAPLLRHVPVTMYTRLDSNMFSNVLVYQKKVYEETQKNNTLFPEEEWKFLTKPAVLHANPDVLKKVVWFARTTGLISPEIVTKTVLFELSLQEFLQLSPCTLQELLRLEDVDMTQKLARLLSAMTVQEFCRLAPDTLVAILKGCRDSSVLFDALCPIIKILTKEQLDTLASDTKKLLLQNPFLPLLKELVSPAPVEPDVSLTNLAVKQPVTPLSPNSWVKRVQGVWTGLRTWVSNNLLPTTSSLEASPSSSSVVSEQSATQAPSGPVAPSYSAPSQGSISHPVSNHGAPYSGFSSSNQPKQVRNDRFELSLHEFLQLPPGAMQELLQSRDENVIKKLSRLLSKMTVQEFFRLESNKLDVILKGCRDSSVLFDALRLTIQELTKEHLDSLAPSTQRLLQNTLFSPLLGKLVSPASVTAGSPSNRPAQKPQLDLGSSSPQVSNRFDSSWQPPSSPQVSNRFDSSWQSPSSPQVSNRFDSSWQPPSSSFDSSWQPPSSPQVSNRAGPSWQPPSGPFDSSWQPPSGPFDSSWQPPSSPQVSNRADSFWQPSSSTVNRPVQKPTPEPTVYFGGPSL